VSDFTEGTIIWWSRLCKNSDLYCNCSL